MKALVLAALLTLTMPAIAGQKTKPQPSPTPSAQASSQSTSSSKSLSASASSARSRSRSEIGDITTNAANSGVTSGSAVSISTRALGLDLPPQIPVEAPRHPCHYTTASKGAFGIGASGRTKIDKGNCDKRENALTFLELGRPDIGVRYLCAELKIANCESAHVPALPVAAAPPADCDELERRREVSAAVSACRREAHRDLDK